MKTCDLCLQPGDEITHLDLYVIGSEGINVCLSCRLILSNVASGIRSTSAKVKLNYYKQNKR